MCSMLLAARFASLVMVVVVLVVVVLVCVLPVMNVNAAS